VGGKIFDRCVFENCSLIECRFEECTFMDCKFKGCVLSALKLTNSSFLDTKFVGSKVIGCDWTKTKSLRALEFDNCQLDFSNFSMLKLHHLKLNGCTAKEVDFSGADLTEADFEGTDLEKSRFVNTNLTKASLRKAVNYAIDFKLNKLKKTVFSLPEALSLLDSLDIVIKD
jgi:uncharacterized protein YjbI with pentapeptide repeats